MKWLVVVVALVALAVLAPALRVDDTPSVKAGHSTRR